MKPFIGVDLTYDKNNEQQNGEQFLVAKPSGERAQKLKESVETVQELAERSKLPLPFRVTRWISGAVGMMLILGLFKAFTGVDRVSFAEGYRNAPELYWLTCLCLIIWMVLTLFAKRKEKDVLNSDGNECAMMKLDEALYDLLKELGVPDDAYEVDIISLTYKMKGGKPKPYEKLRRFNASYESLRQLTAYNNLTFNMFADDETFYVACPEGKYGIPLASLRGISTVKKDAMLANWNKETRYDAGEYEQYKLFTDNVFKAVHTTKYHILRFECDGEEWGIYFPNYELPFFEEVTGLNAE